MKRRRHNLRLPKESLTQTAALLALLFLGAMGLAGPSGLLAWSENARMLEQRQKEVAQLTAERDHLRNRVNLLDPRHADPDLVGERCAAILTSRTLTSWSFRTSNSRLRSPARLRPLYAGHAMRSAQTGHAHEGSKVPLAGLKPSGHCGSYREALPGG
jgi:cell division protein FtsB